MYPNVEMERTMKKVTLAMLANVIHCTVSTLSLKLSGKAPLLFREAVAIKEFLQSELPLEELFEFIDLEAER